jgi:hypothetical protein
MLLGSRLAATGNFNLNMMLKIGLKNIKRPFGLIKDTKGPYIHVERPYNSPITKRYAGYTV